MPDTRHWFDDVFTAPHVQRFVDDLFAHADKVRRPWDKLPYRFTLTTANPDESGSLHGFRIAQLDIPGRSVPVCDEYGLSTHTS